MQKKTSTIFKKYAYKLTFFFIFFAKCILVLMFSSSFCI